MFTKTQTNFPIVSNALMTGSEAKREQSEAMKAQKQWKLDNPRGPTLILGRDLDTRPKSSATSALNTELFLSHNAGDQSHQDLRIAERAFMLRPGQPQPVPRSLEVPPLELGPSATNVRDEQAHRQLPGKEPLSPLLLGTSDCLNRRLSSTSLPNISFDNILPTSPMSPITPLPKRWTLSLSPIHPTQTKSGEQKYTSNSVPSIFDIPPLEIPAATPERSMRTMASNAQRPLWEAVRTPPASPPTFRSVRFLSVPATPQKPRRPLVVIKRNNQRLTARKILQEEEPRCKKCRVPWPKCKICMAPNHIANSCPRRVPGQCGRCLEVNSDCGDPRCTRELWCTRCKVHTHADHFCFYLRGFDPHACRCEASQAEGGKKPAKEPAPRNIEVLRHNGQPIMQRERLSADKQATAVATTFHKWPVSQNKSADRIYKHVLERQPSENTQLAMAKRIFSDATTEDVPATKCNEAEPGGAANLPTDNDDCDTVISDGSIGSEDAELCEQLRQLRAAERALKLSAIKLIPQDVEAPPNSPKDAEDGEQQAPVQSTSSTSANNNKSSQRANANPQRLPPYRSQVVSDGDDSSDSDDDRQQQPLTDSEMQYVKQVAVVEAIQQEMPVLARAAEALANYVQDYDKQPKLTIKRANLWCSQYEQLWSFRRRLDQLNEHTTEVRELCTSIDDLTEQMSAALEELDELTIAPKGPKVDRALRHGLRKAAIERLTMAKLRAQVVHHIVTCTAQQIAHHETGETPEDYPSRQQAYMRIMGQRLIVRAIQLELSSVTAADPKAVRDAQQTCARAHHQANQQARRLLGFSTCKRCTYTHCARIYSEDPVRPNHWINVAGLPSPGPTRGSEGEPEYLPGGAIAPAHHQATPADFNQSDQLKAEARAAATAAIPNYDGLPPASPATRPYDLMPISTTISTPTPTTTTTCFRH